MSTAATCTDSLAFVRDKDNQKAIRATAWRMNECADDVAQELHIYFPIWVKTYDPNRGASLKTYIFNKLSWHLRERRRVEFRHVTSALDGEIQPSTDVDEDDAQEEQGRDLRDAQLPAGLPDVVRQTLEAARGCETIRDLAAALCMSRRGTQKRLQRARKLAKTREPVQFDLFDLEPEGV